MKEGWKKIATQVKEKTQCIGKARLIFSCHCLWKDALYVIIYTLKIMHLSNKNLLVWTGCSTEQRPQTTLKEPQESLSKCTRISNFHFLFKKIGFIASSFPSIPPSIPHSFFSLLQRLSWLYFSPQLCFGNIINHMATPQL